MDIIPFKWLSKMNELRIQFGLDADGNIIAAENAVKGKAYFCPACSERVVIKAGKIRAKHFSHPSASNCNHETVLHQTAKHLIIAAIENNAKNSRVINLHDKCAECYDNHVIELIPTTFSHAGMEIRIDNYICDIVGYKRPEGRLAIEIFATNKLEDIKAKNLGVYWIELKAEDVIENPYSWKPIQKNLKSTYCTKCKIHFSNVIKIADKWGIDRSLYSPAKKLKKAKYIADTEVCFNCKNEIPVFWWAGVPFCTFEPPLPRPKTIKFKYSRRYGGSYWANTCANCGAIQGDNFLFLFDEAPFKCMPQIADCHDHHLEPGTVTIRTLNRQQALAFMRDIDGFSY